MRGRILTIPALIGIIAIGAIWHKTPVKAQQLPATRNVSLGAASFSPNNIPVNGISTLTVNIATGQEVPAYGTDGNTPIRAVIQITLYNNPSGITHTITPSQLQKVNLVGGGQLETPQFDFTIDSSNTKSGSISYHIELVALENATGLAQKAGTLTLDSTLTVGAPPPTPTPTPKPVFEDDVPCYKTWAERCVSPIIIDMKGNGYDLTDAAHGVNFDLDANIGITERVAWTAANSDDAFLMLDRDGNGRADNGTELFGNVTPQPYSPVPNGFVALAQYDKVERGGNDDGIIDSRDEVFSQLRLWTDSNHNGICEPNELRTLLEMGIQALSLDYKESRHQDRNGNLFRFRAKVSNVNQNAPERWAYDVFLRDLAPW